MTRPSHNVQPRGVLAIGIQHWRVGDSGGQGRGMDLELTGYDLWFGS